MATWKYISEGLCLMFPVSETIGFTLTIAGWLLTVERSLSPILKTWSEIPVSSPSTSLARSQSANGDTTSRTCWYAFAEFASSEAKTIYCATIRSDRISAVVLKVAEHPLAEVHLHPVRIAVADVLNRIVPDSRTLLVVGHRRRIFRNERLGKMLLTLGCDFIAPFGGKLQNRDEPSIDRRAQRKEEERRRRRSGRKRAYFILRSPFYVPVLAHEH